MTSRKLWLAIFLVIGSISTAQGQDVDPRLLSPDPNNASIAGRILLPSGRSADTNIKVTLSNQQSTLMTLFTSEHGEFQFLNLSEGIYFLQAVADANLFEAVTESIRLSRSQNGRLNLTLRSKALVINAETRAGTVSTKELEQQVPASARKAYTKAVKLMGKGRRVEAVQQLRRSLELFPDYLAARNDLGAQYLRLKQFPEATAEFQRILDVNPNYVNAHFNLGLVLLEQKNYSFALARLRQALTLDPARPDIQLWLGVALLETDDLPAADRAITKALITGNNQLPVVHFYLARLYGRRGDVAAAERSLKIYLTESPKGEQAEEAKAMLNKLNKTKTR